LTTFVEATEAIYQRFVDNFTGVSLANITFDNEEFDPTDSTGWVRLVVRNLGRDQETLGKKGNRRFKTPALALVQVFTPANTGIKQAGTLAQEAADIFEGESFSGLDFQSAPISPGGPDKKWYQLVVEAQFDFDEIK